MQSQQSHSDLTCAMVQERYNSKQGICSHVESHSAHKCTPSNHADVVPTL